MDDMIKLNIAQKHLPQDCAVYNSTFGQLEQLNVGHELMQAVLLKSHTKYPIASSPALFIGGFLLLVVVLIVIGVSTKPVQCSAYTKKGQRCKNMTTNANGRCHLH